MEKNATGALRKRHRHSLRMAVQMIFLSLALLVSISFVTTAKNVFVITDGDETIIVKTLSSDTDDAIVEAGISLNEDDTYSYEFTGDSFNVNINRIKTVTVEHLEKTYVIETYSNTVEAVLADLEIKYDHDDVINYGLADVIFDGMLITVTDIQVSYETFETVLDFETIATDNDEIYEGNSRVITEGVPGLRITAQKTTYMNGALHGTETIYDAVLSEPVTEVIENGTKSKALKSTEINTSYTGTDSSSVIANEGNSILLDNGETLNYSYSVNMTATAYTTELQENKITASGAVAAVGIVAVDRRVIPLGTKLYIVAADGSWVYGYAIAGDTGVLGYSVDLFFDYHSTCVNFGVSKAIVYVLE